MSSFESLPAGVSRLIQATTITGRAHKKACPVGAGSHFTEKAGGAQLELIGLCSVGVSTTTPHQNAECTGKQAQ